MEYPTSHFYFLGIHTRLGVIPSNIQRFSCILVLVLLSMARSKKEYSCQRIIKVF